MKYQHFSDADEGLIKTKKDVFAYLRRLEPHLSDEHAGISDDTFYRTIASMKSVILDLRGLSESSPVSASVIDRLKVIEKTASSAYLSFCHYQRANTFAPVCRPF